MKFSPADKLRFLEQELAIKIMQLAQKVAAEDISQNEADWQLALLREIIADYQEINTKARTHELKSWPDYFAPLAQGLKSFELRRHDRDFQVGDLLVIREWDDRTKKYSGAEIQRRIVYMMTAIGQGAIEPLVGLNRGYCILGLVHPLSGEHVHIKSEAPHTLPIKIPADADLNKQEA